MKLKEYLALLGLMYCFLVMAQEPLPEIQNISSPSYVLPSSNNYSLVRSIDAPIDYAYGKVAVKIPLYTLQHKGYEIPVYLQYDGGGVRVNEAAGTVGLGWSLVAGGAITRTVKDKRDERPFYGYFETIDDVYALASDESDCLYEDMDDLDTMPDMFYYATPTTAGRFMYDEIGVPRTLPLSPIKISTPFGPQSPPTIDYSQQRQWMNYFKIIDTKGFTHVFSEKEYRHTLSQNTYGTGVVCGTSDFGKYVELVRGEYIGSTVRTQTVDARRKDLERHESAWKLSNVYDFNNELVASISYYSVNDIVEKSFTETLDGYKYTATAVVNDVDIKVPKEIVMTNGQKIVFNYSFQSSLPQKHRLTSVEVWDSNSQRLTYTFQYTTINTGYFGISDTRFYLSAINKQNERYATFDYYDLNHTWMAKNYRYSPYVDAWGYFLCDLNMDMDNTLLTYTGAELPCTNGSSASLGGQTDRKNPKLESTRIGALKTYTNQYGGKEEYSYELNTIDDGRPWGGLRISGITYTDANTVQLNRAFRYVFDGSNESSGRSPYTDLSLYQDIIHQIGNGQSTYVNTYGGNSFETQFISSFPQAGDYYYDPMMILYSEVIEEQTGNGRIVRKFRDFNDISQTGFCTDKYLSVDDGTPNSSNLQYYWNQAAGFGNVAKGQFWEVGQIKEELIFSQSNHLLKKTKNTYQSKSNQYIPIYALNYKKSGVTEIPPLAQTFEYGVDFYNRYKMYPSFLQIVNRDDIVYDQVGMNPMTSITNYSYNQLGQLSGTTVDDSEGREIVSSFKYPSDFNGNIIFKFVDQQYQGSNLTNEYAECLSCDEKYIWPSSNWQTPSTQNCSYEFERYISFKPDRCYDNFVVSLYNTMQDPRDIAQGLGNFGASAWLLQYRNAISRPLVSSSYTQEGHIASRHSNYNIIFETSDFINQERWFQTGQFDIPFKIFASEVSSLTDPATPANTDLVSVSSNLQTHIDSNFEREVLASFEKDTELNQFFISSFESREGMIRKFGYDLNHQLRYFIDLPSDMDDFNAYVVEDFERVASISPSVSFGNLSSEGFIGNASAQNPSVSINLSAQHSYLLSFAFKASNLADISINGTAIDPSFIVNKSNGWKYYSAPLAGTSVSVVGSNGMLIDNLSIVPDVFNVGFLEIDELNGVLAILDETGSSTTFSYDDLGRLLEIYDQEGNLKNFYKYGVKQE